MTNTWGDDLKAHHQTLQQAGLWRSRATLSSAQSSKVGLSGIAVLNFSSNDYLGLANNDELKAAAKEALSHWGVGAGASHLVCGHTSPHQALERELATFVGSERAVLFSNGYMSNLAISSAFIGKSDLLLQDKLNHASLIDAGLLSNANFKRYAHNDVTHAQKILQKTDFDKLLLATDAVFSMDGDIAPLNDLAFLSEHNNGLLLVDDAHGFGVLGKAGRGTLNSLGLKPTGQILMMGTLGKAIGSFGAFIAGDAIFIEHLIQKARSYIYTTALPPAVAATSSASVRHILINQGRLQLNLADNIAYFKQRAADFKIPLLPSNTAIQPIMIGDSTVAQGISAALLEKHILLSAIRPPTVPKGSSRLRVALSASHSFEQIDQLVSALDVALSPLLSNKLL